MPDSFTRVVQDWQDGDDQAGHELDRRVRAQLLALVRSRRSEQLRARIDSEGVVNAALKSFLTGVRKHEYPQLANRRDAHRLLSHFAICVLRDQIKAEFAKKKDVRREVSADAAGTGQLVELGQPTPEECEMAVEYWEKFPDVVRDVHKRSIEILELSLEGLNPTQIADELDLGVRNVQKIIKKMIDTWNAWLTTENGHDPPRSEPSKG